VKLLLAANARFASHTRTMHTQQQHRLEQQQ